MYMLVCFSFSLAEMLPECLFFSRAWLLMLGLPRSCLALDTTDNGCNFAACDMLVLVINMVLMQTHLANELPETLSREEQCVKDHAPCGP